MLRRWWLAWGSLIKKLLPSTGSVASITALLMYFLPPPAMLPWWGVATLVVAVIFFIIFVMLEFADHKRRHVFKRKDKMAIEKYMHNWIEYGGRVAIWTRNMSWADNDRTTKLLITKAQHGELILCLPHSTQLTEKLESRGAEVCYYGAESFDSPASRFTIIYFDRDGSSVAVGRTVGDTHVIDEFSAGDHPAYHIAKDLVALVRSNHGHRG